MSNPQSQGNVGPGDSSQSQVSSEQEGTLSLGTDDNMTETSKLETTKTFSGTDEDILRLIEQQLRELGLKQTADQLVAESGCETDAALGVKLIAHVLDGNWEQAYSAIDDLIDMDTAAFPDNIVVKMRFLVLEQKYLELLADENFFEAFNCLRKEINPLQYSTERLHELAQYMALTYADLREESGWAGKGPTSRQKLLEKLHELIPANLVLPPRRLMTLLKQANEFQHEHCSFHNARLDNDPSSLRFLSDHVCSRDLLPCETIQICDNHFQEVWHCKFSPNGKRLAAGSKDGSVMIYKVDQESYKVTYLRTLHNDKKGVAYLAWSPNGRFLVVCGPETSKALYIWTIRTDGDLAVKVDIDAGNSLTCASWEHDSQFFYAGGTCGQFYKFDVFGELMMQMDHIRVQYLQPSHQGAGIVLLADTQFRIRRYNTFDSTDNKILQEDHPIMSFSVSPDGRLALMNVATQGLHLWDLEDKVLLRQFQGITQGISTIYSCFGGLNRDFIASGSEDLAVHIFHSRQSKAVLRLVGHRSTVNCVDWNPILPDMLVSASDDGTVRVWGPPSKKSPDDGESGETTPV